MELTKAYVIPKFDVILNFESLQLKDQVYSNKKYILVVILHKKALDTKNGATKPRVLL